MKRAVFLDRDGVLNRPVIRNGHPFPPENIKQLEIIPGSKENLERLKKAGYLLIVVTNQPDVRRGKQTIPVVESMHSKLMQDLPMLDDFFVCYHDDSDRCPCRKPAPGMLLEAATKYQIDLISSFMIGDRWRDIEAGSCAGCRTILIDYGYDEPLQNPPNKIVKNLAEAVTWVLNDG